MKQIAIVVPTLARGGAERVAAQLSKYVATMFQTYVIVMKRDIDYDYTGTLIDINAGSILKRNIFSRLISLGKVTYNLHKIKKMLKFDAVISFLELANIPNILSGSKQTILSVREHKISSTQKDMQRRLTNLLVRFLYNRANKIVVVSKGIEQSLISDYGITPSKIRIIYNAIDIVNVEKRKSEELNQKLSELYSYPVVISVGRLTIQKGQWHLIRAFKKVVQSVPDAKLIVLGEGELKELLTKLVIKMGLAHAVYFVGFQSNPFKFITRSRLFVLPSLWEGFPNALIEAMTCGIPVISTDCNTGPREILAPDTDHCVKTKDVEYAQYGILVPVPADGYNANSGDEPLSAEENKLALSIIELLQNVDLNKHYALRAESRVQDFSSDRIMLQWRQVIEEVVTHS
jgi:glycosyltransferase involved in cell wall biosynthesis